jgi:hypothetical protein
MNDQKIKAVETWPKKAGKSDYLKFLHGERLTQRQAIKAKCYDCCCGEPDACTVKHCSLQPFNALIHKCDGAVEACTVAHSK